MNKFWGTRNRPRRRIDILHVAAGTSPGWRVIDETLRRALLELGVTVERVALRRPSSGLVGRTRSPGNDLYQAACLVAAAERGLRSYQPRAILYSSSHAALLQPRRPVPEAVWIDGPIAWIRPGIHNMPLRTLERLRHRRLDVVIVMSLQHSEALLESLRPRDRAVLHVAIDPAGADASVPSGITTPYGVTYAGAPGKKGLDLATQAWRYAAPNMPLLVTGISKEAAERYLGHTLPTDVRCLGAVPRAVHRAIVKSARLYVSASRREEYGMAQLEALMDGVPLAACPSEGPADAVAVARRLSPMLVADDFSPLALAECIRTVMELSPAELASYRAAAAPLMASYSYSAFKEALVRDVLPKLLPD